jgi:hypothetical protein
MDMKQTVIMLRWWADALERREAALEDFTCIRHVDRTDDG